MSSGRADATGEVGNVETIAQLLGSARCGDRPVRRANLSQLFSYDLVEDVALEGQVGDDLLQFRILMAQRSQLAQLLQTKSGELLFLLVKRLLADAEPAAHLGDLLAAFDLVQGMDDLLVAPTFARHRLRLLGRLSRPAWEITDRVVFTFPLY